MDVSFPHISPVQSLLPVSDWIKRKGRGDLDLCPTSGEVRKRTGRERSGAKMPEKKERKRKEKTDSFG